MDYILETSRLGLRQWQASDLVPWTHMNQDPQVMEFFPRPLTPEESAASQTSLMAHYDAHGFTYFAVDTLTTAGPLASGEFIGFIGLKLQTFEHPRSPFVDIGWRLQSKAWGLGLATEGAQACLRFGFEDRKFHAIYSVAPTRNTRSTRVMQKVGFSHLERFLHPALAADDRLNPCDLYQLTRADFEHSTGR